jgi:regulator of replication initiation timing
MKKLISIIGILMVLSILIPSVVLASDPTETEVDVVVVSGGDVKVNLDVNSTTSNIIVDGVNIRGAMGEVSAGVSEVYVSLRDLWNSYNKSTPLTQKQIDDMKNILNLLSDATAKLIMTQDVMEHTAGNNDYIMHQSLAEMQGSINTLYEETVALETTIKSNYDSNFAGQTELAKKFDMLSNDSLSNFQTQANAINNFNIKTEELHGKADKATRVAVIASIIAVLSLVFSVVMLVKGKAK